MLPDEPAAEYFVADEQLMAFGAQTVERRLAWLDETRAFVLQTASEQTLQLWRAQRLVQHCPGLADVVRRRISFLLTEAQAPAPTYDQAVIYAMRVISNHATIGQDGHSDDIKRSNRRMSEAARRLKDTVTFKEWLKAVRNEHPEPLKVVWKWLRENAQNLTEEAVWWRFCQYPMVTITCDEDKKLSSIGMRSRGAPEERYRAAGIEIDL